MARTYRFEDIYGDQFMHPTRVKNRIRESDVTRTDQNDVREDIEEIMDRYPSVARVMSSLFD